MAKIKRNKKSKRVWKSPANKATDFFKQIKEEDLELVEHKIRDNVFNEDIARWIQEEKGYFKELKLRTVKENVSRYRKYVVQPKLLETMSADTIFTELLVLKEKVDSVKEFSCLVVQQKERLNRALSLERRLDADGRGLETKTGRDMALQARKEIKLMADTLEKLANLQMKTGLLKVAPRVISGEMVHDEDDPSKITFQLREDFMEQLDAIEAELIDGPNANVIEVQEDGSD